MAARAERIEIENNAVKRTRLKIIFSGTLFIVTIEYRRKGTLNAIEAAVMFLLPATPLRDIASKVRASS